MKERILRLEIKDEKDLRLLEDAYNLSFNCALVRTFRELTEKMMLEYDLVEIHFPLSFLSAAYQKVPNLFVRQLKKKMIDYSVDISKQGERILFRCGYMLKPKLFTARIRDALLEHNSIDVPEDEVPPSFRSQPFVLPSRLKREGLPVILVRIGKTWRYARRVKLA